MIEAEIKETQNKPISFKKPRVQCQGNQRIVLNLEFFEDVIRSLIKLLAVMVVAWLVTACAEIKEAGRSIGDTTRNVTHDIGYGSRNTVQAIGKGTKRVVKSITEDPEKAQSN